MSAPKLRDPRARLAAAELHARAVIAARQAEQRRAERAARLAQLRDALASVEARRAARPRTGSDVYTRPSSPPPLDALAARERAVPGIIAAARHLDTERHADALAAIPETPETYEWSRP